MSQFPRKETLPSGVVIDVDFSEDECERRMNELMRPCLGIKGSFDMETGHPFDGPKLSDDELRRRGYDVPTRK